MKWNKLWLILSQFNKTTRFYLSIFLQTFFKSSMDTLPPELEFEILKHLETSDLPAAGTIYPEHLFQTFIWKNKIIGYDEDTWPQYSCFPIQTLYCGLTSISDEGIRGLTKLRTLWCQGTSISDEGIRGLTNLRTLWCQGTSISDEGIRGLTNLRQLDCWRTSISDEGIRGLTNLRTLYCYGTSISDEGIRGLTNLRTLYCWRTSISEKMKRIVYERRVNLL
jgi:hypothetical protein